MMASRIPTERLELVSLDPTFLASWLAGDPLPDLGFSDPSGFLVGAEDVVRLRLDQLKVDPGIAPWLLRAIVQREDHVAVGFIGFHAAPDERGMVEIGYEVLPAFRQRGYATEAVGALMKRAARQGAQIVRACVSPANAASLAVLAHHGFTLVGEQIDDEEGRELVFEKSLVEPT